MLACVGSLASGVWTAAAAASPAYVPREVIVGYRPGPVSTATADLELQMGTRQPGQSTAPRSSILHLRRGETVEAAIARLRHQPGVAYAEPDYIARAAGDWVPDDPGRAHVAQGWQMLQWNLLANTGVNAPDAWGNLLADHRPGGRGVVVAILDTGVAYRNWQKFVKSPDFGGTRFVSPYDFIAHNRFPLDRNGHGTFVAGIVAEATNNNYSLTGLAYGASIMPLRVLDASGLGDEATIARAIRYAVHHGAQIINLSLEFLPSQVSSAADIPEIVSAISYAHAHGVTVVGAAGNDQTRRRIAYPARAHDVISVGATTKDRCLADYSNQGTGLDLVAPGGGTDAALTDDSDCNPNHGGPPIWQLTLDNPPHWGRFGYPNYYIGTSMSAPEVSATAALVIASGVIGRHPTPAAILLRLEQTATQLGPTQPNDQYGYGMINAGLATTSGVVSAPTPPTTPGAPASPIALPTSGVAAFGPLL